MLNQLVFSVDYIIFASGAAHYGLFQDTKEQVMDDMLTLHVKAPWMITQYLLLTMIQKKAALISEIPINRAGLPSEVAHTVRFVFYGTSVLVIFKVR